VKVPDAVRESVAFLGYRNADEMSRGGTGFFVSVAVGGRDLPYLVTALHVVEHCTRLAVDGLVQASCNTASGPAWISLPRADWVLPDPGEEYVDVAVFPWWTLPPKHRVQFKHFPEEGAITAEVIKEQGVGPGDELYFPGLFLRHPGAERNSPIIRRGAIAAMPEELVTLADGRKSRVYLVEARSIGGLSGSPVFIRPSGLLEMDPEKQQPEKKWRFLVASLPFYLLGVMHGHWQIAAPGGSVSGAEVVNMGIGMVTPVAAVAALLDHPAQREARARFGRGAKHDELDVEPPRF